MTGSASDVATGAAGGAAYGTAILPGYGTVLGGVLGGAYGYFAGGGGDKPKWHNGKYIGRVAQQGIYDAQHRQAPQAAGTTIGGIAQQNTGQSDQFRQGQMSLADNLRGVLSGQQQGAGELAVQRQAQRALGNAAGAATMARGNSAVGGARAAARGAGAIGLGAAGEAQQAAIGDQASARQQLAGVLGQGREQDIGIAGANQNAENQRIFQQAGLDQATSLANMQARLQAIGMNDAAIANYLQMIGVMDQGEMVAGMTAGNRMGGFLAGGGAALADKYGSPQPTT